MTTEAMKLALDLAMKGAGKTSPNPRVGAVILKDNLVISTGWHNEYGGDHAEVACINNAHEDLEGATLVVNLEPCAHQGHTPPCVDAIIERKFAKVVIGMVDPNPLVSGKGIEKLKAAGIEVEVGVLEEECRWVNRFFIKYITTGKPYIALKVAQSINGAIATASGDSKWITSDASRQIVHRLRAEFDAVLVGKGTINKDNPELTARNVIGRHPKRIVFDSKLSLNLNLNVFVDSVRKNTIIVYSNDEGKQRKVSNLKLAGITCIKADSMPDGRIDLNSALDKLVKECQITSIMVEGGSKIFSSFLSEDIVDELHLFSSPIIIGGGINSFANFNTMRVANAKKFALKKHEWIDKDLYCLMLPEISQ